MVLDVFFVGRRVFHNDEVNVGFYSQSRSKKGQDDNKEASSDDETSKADEKVKQTLWKSI